MNKNTHPEKILLALLPFWTSLIPPMGISCLKSFLQRHGYAVKAVDLNVHGEFRDIYNNYLNTLKEFIPGNKRGNFYNVVNDVIRNHMMAHLNVEDEDKTAYIELVKLVVTRTFFCAVDDGQVLRLDEMIARFYRRLERFFVELLEQEKPSVLGLSVYSDTAPASLFAFKLAKKVVPHIRTVMGGGIFTGDLDMSSPNFSFFLEKAHYVDKIIVGEGEILFLKYLQGELPGDRRVYTLKDLPGERLDLESADVPDFSDFVLRYYPNLAAYTSRSCPFNCSFCSEVVIWGKYRKKKPHQVVRELKTLYEKHRYQLFLMTDSLLNPIITPLSEAFIESGLSLYWDGYLRADQPVCNPENTLLWRRGGFYRARLGLESGSQRVLQAMGKKIIPDQIKCAVSSLANAGIKTTTYWVIGHPGETEEDFQQTLLLVEELKDDIYEAECNPFNYFLTGQVNSDEWARENKSVLLFPEKAKHMLILQRWILNGEPSREVMYQRINRFVEHCKNLGIPNPYNLQEIYDADERWRRLHKNAVPSIVEFQPGEGNSRTYIDENRTVKRLVFARNVRSDEDEGEGEGDWGFDF